MKTLIHVNQFVIKKNRLSGERKPVLTVKTYKDNKYAHEAIILDKEGNEVARVVYRPDKPLSCGAVCWIETKNEVRLVNEPSDSLSLEAAQDSSSLASSSAEPCQSQSDD